MVSMHSIRDEYYGDLCRHCINRSYKANLKDEDCIFGDKVEPCSFCRKEKRLVVGLHFSGRMKLLLK